MSATDDLLAQLEQEARERSWGLEALGKLPGPKKCPTRGFTARHYPLTLRERLELDRHKAAMQAADGPDTFLALLRGEPVPLHRIRVRVTRYLEARRNGR